MRTHVNGDVVNAQEVKAGEQLTLWWLDDALVKGGHVKHANRHLSARIRTNNGDSKRRCSRGGQIRPESHEESILGEDTALRTRCIYGGFCARAQQGVHGLDRGAFAQQSSPPSGTWHADTQEEDLAPASCAFENRQCPQGACDRVGAEELRGCPLLRLRRHLGRASQN